MTAPRMRAGTAERQAAVDDLSRHFADGRLTAGEFDERVTTAYGATYLDELPDLFVDLPADEPRRGAGTRRPGAEPRFTHDTERFGQVGPDGRPGSWVGPHRPPGPLMYRAPRFLGVFFVLAVIFSISSVAHGFFPLPLIWLALVLLFISRRRRWAGSGHPGHRR